MLRQSTLTLLVIVLLGAAHAAGAAQHLVSPGTDWSRLLPRLKPGDEVILMPGRHVAVSLTNLHGDERRPIVIRGFSPEHTALIGGRQFGIELINPRNVVLRDLHIVGASEVGVRIDMRSDDSSVGVMSAGVRLERVRIDRSGDYETGRGLFVRGARQIFIDDCRIEGWGLTAAEFVACHEITINRTAFIGSDRHAQFDGIHFRAGCRMIWLNEVRIEGVIETLLRLGGGSRAAEFIPPLPDDPDARPRYEVEQVSIEQCMFIGGQCAITFDGSRRTTMRNSTIAHPRLWMFQFARSLNDSRIGTSTEVTLGENLFIWEGDALRRLVHEVNPGAGPGGSREDSSAFRLEENLWWAEGGVVDLGDVPFRPVLPQVIDVDPGFDRQTHLPTEPRALQFGAIGRGGALTSETPRPGSR